MRRNELFTNTAIDTVQKNRIVKGNVEYIIDEIFGDEDIFDIYSDYISGKIRESNITAAMEIAAWLIWQRVDFKEILCYNY